MKHRGRALELLLPVLALLLMALVAFTVGKFALGWEDVLRLFWAKLTATPHALPASTENVVFGIRAPRIAGAILVGAALSAAGAAYQELFRNPLVSPDILTFHDQVGYWLWEPATGLVMQTLAIPRGQIAIAAGHAEPNATKLIVKAERGQTEYGICSTTFLERAFRTDSYRFEVEFHSDGSWSYVSDTTLMVRGRDAPFLHRDRNTLIKVAEADLNPWARIIRGKRTPSTGP